LGKLILCISFLLSGGRTPFSEICTSVLGSSLFHPFQRSFLLSAKEKLGDDKVHWTKAGLREHSWSLMLATRAFGFLLSSLHIYKKVLQG